MVGKSDDVTTYHRVTEHNSWEGETWYHYFENDQDGRVLDSLIRAVDKCDFLSDPDSIELAEAQTTVLANLEPGYMDIHWFGELTDFDGLANATSEDLYKGGIRKYGVEVFGYDEDNDNNEICGETFDHDIDRLEKCVDGTTYWHCRRCDAEGFDPTTEREHNS
jgi:hypothetical protein